MEKSDLYEAPTLKTHLKPYPAISPTLPEHSQAGKTVLVTGGSKGIGLGIARGFATAGATTVIIIGRDEKSLAFGAGAIAAANAATKVLTRSVDIGSLESTAALWEWLESEGIVIDVLVLNAAKPGLMKPLVDVGVETAWDLLTIHVRSHLDFTTRFAKQDRKGSAIKPVLLETTSLSVYKYLQTPPWPIYALWKTTGLAVLAQVAKNTPVETMRIVSMDPGLVFTDAFAAAGFKENDWDWHSPDLAGHFAVYLASPEADFLHGRFVHADWDIDEIRKGKVREKIESDPYYLRLGILGLHA